MIAVDTNVLIYADRVELPLHRRALAALRRLAEGSEPGRFRCFPAIQSLRLTTF